MDSNALYDLLRADLVCESYVPDREHRELRQLVRVRIELDHERTSFINKLHAILAKYEYQPPARELYTEKNMEWLKAIQSSFHGWTGRMAVDSYAGVLGAVSSSIQKFTAKIGSISKEDESVRLLMTIPGVEYLSPYHNVGDRRRTQIPYSVEARRVHLSGSLQERYR